MKGDSSEALEWRDTLAGWQIVVPESVLPEWRGAENYVGPGDGTHFAQACESGCVLHVLSKPVFVFNGFVGRVAWVPSLQGHVGDVVLQVAADNEADIIEELTRLQPEDFDGDEADCIPAVGETTWRMIDPTDFGPKFTEGSIAVELPDAPLRILPGYVERETGLAFHFSRIVRNLA